MLLFDPETDPAFNLAAEEYLLREKGEEPIIRLWRNAPCLVLGRHQIPWMEINALEAEALSIPAYRRISGGGTVYHDPGNLNFSLIGPLPKDTGIDFERMLQPIVKALTALGIPVEHVGRGDVRIAGSKISGNAAYLWRGRCLHHGTLLYDANLDTLERLLEVPPNTDWNARSIRSVRSPVTQISQACPGRFADIRAFAKALCAKLSFDTPRSFTQEERHQINKLKNNRYNTPEWNLGEAPSYMLKRNTSDGPMELRVEKGRISDISITGQPAPKWTKTLYGLWHRPKDIRKALQELPKDEPAPRLEAFF